MPRHRSTVWWAPSCRRPYRSKWKPAGSSVVVFDDIYPSRVGGLGDVYTHSYTDITEKPDGSKDEEKWTAWRFKDADLGFHFSKSYQLPGEELRVIFQSGPLAGMDFEVIFNPYDPSSDIYQSELLEDGTWNPKAQVYEVKRNDDYGRMLPDEILHPTSGDTYILYGYDPQFISDKLIPDAEKEVEKRAREYINELKQDPSTYDTTMMSDYVYGIDPDTGMYDPAFSKRFSVGQKVNADVKISDGDMIVTSNVSKKFLPGILIGYAKDIETDSNNLTQSGYVIPAVDFKHIQKVLIITQKKITGDTVK